MSIVNPNAGVSDELINDKENEAIHSSEWNAWETQNKDPSLMKASNSPSTNKSLASVENNTSTQNTSQSTAADSNNSFSSIVAEKNPSDLTNPLSIRANHQRTESDLSLNDINECLKTLSMNPNNSNRFVSVDDFVNRPLAHDAPLTRDNDRGRVSYPPSKSKLAMFENQFNGQETGFIDEIENTDDQYLESNIHDGQADLQIGGRQADRAEGSLIDSRNMSYQSGQPDMYPPNTGYHRENYDVNMRQSPKNLPYGGAPPMERFQPFPNKFGYQDESMAYSGNEAYMNNNYVNDGRNDPNRQAYGMGPRGYYPPQQQYRPMVNSGPVTNPEYEDDYYGNNNYYNDGTGVRNNGMANVDNLSPIVSGFDGFVYKVQFKRSHRNFLRSAGVDKPIRNGDFVIVEADRGEDLGVVCEIQPMPNFFREGGSLFAKDTKVSAWGDRRTGVKHIIRHALPQEYSLLPVKVAEEQSIVEVCRDQCHVYLLPMLVVDAEYQFDRHKLTIFYESNSRRIDFRELVRDLFAIYKTRIWMEVSKKF